MILGNVTVPPVILDAIEKGTLAVFAGAGVSMGEPANLPSFWKLALNLAKGTALAPKLLGTGQNGSETWEQLDQFLGRLGVEDKVIRQRAANFLDAEMMHTELHVSLNKLFKEIGQVRIVTTNFDTLFESAADSLWDSKPTIYTAPALPLGNRFNGIVHIHGAINPSESIVLTDGDFGRAYLTEGWARRFLVDLFEKYTVLFVGYSHDDTVLQYLARALPDKANDKRFSLISTDESVEKWQFLGITPIVFNKKNKEDYSQLYSLVNDLAEFSNTPHSQWQRNIWRIAGGSPEDISSSDKATIRHAFQDVTKVRYFCQKARHQEWPLWLNNEGFLDQVFLENKPSEVCDLLRLWLVNNFAVQYSERFFQLFSIRGLKIEPWLWFELARKIGLDGDEKSFCKWLDILLQTKPNYIDYHALHWLAEKSHDLNYFDGTLQVYEVMAASYVRFNKSSRLNEKGEFKVQSELATIAGEWSLTEVWKDFLLPNLEENFLGILNSCCSLLLSRYHLSQSWEGGYQFDSLHREDISCPERGERGQVLRFALAHKTRPDPRLF